MEYIKRLIKSRQIKNIREENQRREKLLKATRQSNVVFYREKKII